LNSAEFTIIPATTINNIAKMELELAGPRKLNIAAATWDTDLRSNSENPELKPQCMTDGEKVTCENIQSSITQLIPIKFWLKFAFENTKSVTGTCIFFDAEGHELATFTMDSVTTLKNDDASGKLVLNAPQGEYVKTWDKQDPTKCGPLGTDTVNPTVLSWET
jgi:hypothetical protein